MPNGCEAAAFDLIVGAVVPSPVQSFPDNLKSGALLTTSTLIYPHDSCSTLLAWLRLLDEDFGYLCCICLRMSTVTSEKKRQRGVDLSTETTISHWRTRGLWRCLADLMRNTIGIRLVYRGSVDSCAMVVVQACEQRP